MSARRLAWYVRWGDYIVGLTEGGLTHEQAVLAARKAHEVMNAHNRYGYATTAHGAQRGLEMAAVDIPTGRFAEEKAKRERKAAAQMEEFATEAMVWRTDQAARLAISDLAFAALGMEREGYLCEAREALLGHDRALYELQGLAAAAVRQDEDEPSA